MATGALIIKHVDGICWCRYTALDCFIHERLIRNRYLHLLSLLEEIAFAPPLVGVELADHVVLRGRLYLVALLRRRGARVRMALYPVLHLASALVVDQLLHKLLRKNLVDTGAHLGYWA